MSKTMNFGFLLITLSTLHVSYNVIEGNVIPLASNEELLDFLRNKILERSNYYRKKFRLNEFTLNAEMNNKAQQWANLLGTSTMLRTDPKNRGIYGENVAKIPPLVNLGEKVVDIWYCFAANVEVSRGINGYFGNKYVGTLTQLLWNSSTQIGVGVSQNVQNDYYVVVYYNPPGNQLNGYRSSLPLLRLDDAIKGQQIKESFYSNQKKKIFVSTPTYGFQRLTQETGKFVIPSLSYMYTSRTVPKGLNVIEANSIRKEVLERNNYYRRLHGLNDLIIAEIYNKTAQHYVNQMALNMVLTSHNQIKSKIDPLFGENKYKSPPTIFGNFGEVAVDTWYNQIRLLRENMKESEYLGKPETGCLTQMLWRKTQIIGVGVSVDDVGNYYLLVHYYPVGNVENTFLANLPKFTNAQISAGEKANDKMNKLAGGETEFKLPRWNMVTKLEE